MPQVNAIILAVLLAAPALPQAILPPAVNQDGSVVVFAGELNPDGTRQSASDAWLWRGGAWFTQLRRLTDYARGAATYGVGRGRWRNPFLAPSHGSRFINARRTWRS